jgi:alpha-L-rhamnosidase
MQEQSPWRVADYDLGGTYDARLYEPGWTAPGYAENGWNKAVVLPAPSRTRIDPEMVQPCRVSEVLEPAAEYEPRPGVHVFDFGKQFTGVCRFTVNLPTGCEIRLRHAQVLRKDKSLDVSNLKNNAKNVTAYISAGGKSEHFEGLPFHFNGCRYVEISGLPSRDALKELDAIHFGDAMRPVSSLQTSDPRLKRLWEIMRRTYHSNLKSGILTDCVGRNERGAWLGDGYTSHINTVGYFFDSAAHHRKRMQDIRDQVSSRGGATPPGQVGCRAPSFGDASCPFWSDAATVAPRNARVFYDDLHIIERQYGDGEGQAKALVDFYQAQNGPSGKWTRLDQPFKIWGPWLDRAIHLPPGSDRTRWNSLDYPSTWFSSAKKVPSTSKEAFGTFWWATSARATADMARYLGNNAEAQRYDEMADRCNQALIRDFDNGNGTWDLNDQPIYTYGLISGVTDGDLKPVFLTNLVQTVKAYGGHFSGGSDVFFQTLIALSRNSYPDLAWFMAMRPEMPSFGYMIDAGATTFWERFDLHHPEWGLNRIGGTLDFNHVGFLPLGEWIIGDIVGLRPDPAQPGFKHFFIRPWTGGEPKSLSFSFDSPRGPIRVAWQRDGDRVVLDATIPPNCSATVEWPDGKKQTLESGTHTLTGDALLKKGKGIEGGLDELRRYFKENCYDSARDTNRGNLNP